MVACAAVSIGTCLGVQSVSHAALDTHASQMTSLSGALDFLKENKLPLSAGLISSAALFWWTNQNFKVVATPLAVGILAAYLNHSRARMMQALLRADRAGDVLPLNRAEKESFEKEKFSGQTFADLAAFMSTERGVMFRNPQHLFFDALPEGGRVRIPASIQVIEQAMSDAYVWIRGDREIGSTPEEDVFWNGLTEKYITLRNKLGLLCKNKIEGILSDDQDLVLSEKKLAAEALVHERQTPVGAALRSILGLTPFVKRVRGMNEAVCSPFMPSADLPRFVVVDTEAYQLLVDEIISEWHRARESGAFVYSDEQEQTVSVHTDSEEQGVDAVVSEEVEETTESVSEEA